MILFRADGNSTLGMGHIMRCLSIADALRERGNEVEFVLAESHVRELVESRGYKTHILNSSYNDMESEIVAFRNLSAFSKAQAIIIDSYYVTEKYIASIKDKKLVYIDDYFTKMPVDLIINYSIYADEREYEGVYNGNPPKLLLGPSYAPLRKAFYGSEKKKIVKEASNVLVLTGGADSLHVALNFAKVIREKSDGPLCFNFVVGMMSKDYYDIIKIADSSKGSIVVYHNVEDMKAIMSKCDMAISASGSTMYELSSCGVPTINYTLADNQILGALAFEKKGIMQYAGDVREKEDFYENLFFMTKKLANDKNCRQQMSEKASSLVDGKGAERLAIKLEEFVSERRN